MMGFGYGGSSLWGLYMLLQMAIPVILIILCLWLVNGVWNRKRNVEIDPLHILKERYARGELSREEFTEMKKELKNTV